MGDLNVYNMGIASNLTSSRDFVINNVVYKYMQGCKSTYDHRLVRTGHPVRSAILKHQIGRSVVGWVTTSEYPLLYVFVLFLLVVTIFWAAASHPLLCKQQRNRPRQEYKTTFKRSKTFQ